MPANAASARNLLLSTDYPLDKVAFKRSGTVFVPQATFLSDTVTVTIPHGLPFVPLCIGSYSKDGYATSFDFGMAGPYINTGFGPVPSPAGAIESDATNIYVNLFNGSTGTTFSYRVTALEPTTIPTSTSITASPATTGLYLDTDYNYMKIYLQGAVVISDDAGFGYKTFTIDHGLGYIPTALVLTEYSGRARLCGDENAVGAAGMDAFYSLTTNSLVISYDPSSAGSFTIHYRIYLDD